MSGFEREVWNFEAVSLLERLRDLSAEDFWKRDPHLVYGPDEARLWTLLAAAGVGVTPARWGDWAKQSPLPHNAEAFADAELEDVALFFIALRRSERFSEGATGAAFVEGRIVAGLARLIELSDQLPYDGAASPWAERGVA